MTGRLVLAGTLTALPILALATCFVRREARRRSLRPLVVTFLLGLVTALPATVVVILASWASIRSPWVAAAVGAFVVTAVPEELLKLLVIRGYSARQSGFLDKTDGLIYGVTAALGFDALENALYAIQGGWMTTVLRAVTAVPMNAATGAILGGVLPSCAGRSRLRMEGPDHSHPSSRHLRLLADGCDPRRRAGNEIQCLENPLSRGCLRRSRRNDGVGHPHGAASGPGTGGVTSRLEAALRGLDSLRAARE